MPGFNVIDLPLNCTFVSSISKLKKLKNIYLVKLICTVTVINIEVWFTIRRCKFIYLSTHTSLREDDGRQYHIYVHILVMNHKTTKCLNQVRCN